ncbi:hypothetical protein CROQUDRAFT_716032 [Cronartium quercuum f. sp. fusiforme G11]|uniref:Uncharacterized protein n=1 Tax=Cronartium quercuum f. sp. fusiforme G11 TaxID=708437 RepID=A0A9P6TBE0_9BASI|nr:hypothetical protein CROQUDRAFT_716032 [Cronartium quercuum f. sp. fusiforme G11]
MTVSKFKNVGNQLVDDLSSILPPAYESLINQTQINEKTPLQVHPVTSVEPPTLHIQLLRCFNFLCLTLSIISTIFISLAITYPTLLDFNFFFLNHHAGFDIPLSHSILTIQVLHLSLVALNPSSQSSHFPISSASQSIKLVQFSVILQIAIILLTPQLRQQQSGLSILSGLTLLCFLDLASSSLSFVDPSPSQPNLLINFRSRLSSHPHSLSRWLIHFNSSSEPIVSRLKQYRSHFYVTFLTFNTLLFTTSILFKAADSTPDQLQSVDFHLGPKIISTSLQFSCSPSIKSGTGPTILYFSPSAKTSFQSSQWIPSELESTRLCIFERPGYGRSFNLPLSHISDTVKVLENVLEQTGEFHRIHHDRRRSGFILIGQGYGALEAQIFASRNPNLIKSILLIEPETKESFFKLNQNLKRIDLVMRSAFRTCLTILNSILNHTFQRSLIELGFFNLNTLTPSPSMTRTLLQEKFLSNSLINYNDYTQNQKTFPKRVHIQTLHEGLSEDDWREALKDILSS